MNHNFKKNGSDPDIEPQEQGRFAWTGGFNFGPLLMAALAAMFPGTTNGQPEDTLRVRRTGSGRKHRYPKRRNMNHVSRRVRRKHRRQAA